MVSEIEIIKIIKLVNFNFRVAREMPKRGYQRRKRVWEYWMLYTINFLFINNKILHEYRQLDFWLWHSQSLRNNKQDKTEKNNLFSRDVLTALSSQDVQRKIVLRRERSNLIVTSSPFSLFVSPLLTLVCIR